MQFTKLVKVLKVLKAQQLKRLKKYINSPYFGVNSAPIALFNFLEPLHPQFDPANITAKKLAAFSAKLHTLKQQETAGVRLLRAIENFIGEEEWQKNEAEKVRFMLAGFNALQLTAAFDKQLEKEMKLLNETNGQNIDTLYQKHLLTELSLNGFKARLNRSQGNTIIPVIETLDKFHALKKLRYLCEVINRQRVLGINYQNGQTDELVKILETSAHPKNPYIYLFVNIYRMMVEPTYAESNIYYQLVKQLIARTGPVPDMLDAMTYAVNQCLYWNNRGVAEAGKEYLWWINWKMKLGLLLEGKKLMPIAFRNIICAAQSQNNTALMDRLIKVYIPYLPTEHLDSNLCFARGLYYYTLKKHKDAMRFFLMAQAKETIVFNCIIRLWQFKCLYEYDRNETDTLFSQLANFEKYLLRYRKELKGLPLNFESFVSYCTKLLKSTNKTMLNYQAELQAEDHFAGKPWLEQQFMLINKKPVRGAHGLHK